MSNDSKTIEVYSEIGNLEKVLLHRPGREINNLHPEYLERLLFDDVPDLDIAQKEHDVFADNLKSNGVEIVYLEELMTETLKSAPEIRKTFVKQFLNEANIENEIIWDKIADHLSPKSDRDLVDTLMAGIRASELKVTLSNNYPLACDPLPNLYFTRDPFATVYDGVSINCMRTPTRRRETIFAQYIFNYHPVYKDTSISKWYSRNDGYSIEGGDELILTDKTMAMGVSSRTDLEAVKKMAKKLFDSNKSFEKVLAFIIPSTRAFMHLDTVFTHADYNKFVIHPEIKGPLKILTLTRQSIDDRSEYDEYFKVFVTRAMLPLEDVLSEVIGDAVRLIPCGGSEPIDSAREQWSDGSNVLTISPGEVVVYERNRITAKILEKAGLKLFVIPSCELSRGRGGPRCMSMPLKRKPIKF